MDTSIATIKHVKKGWEEGWLDKPDTISEQIAQMIFADISDRRGLKQELEMIDDDIKEEMKSVWAEIINKMIDS